MTQMLHSELIGKKFNRITVQSIYKKSRYYYCKCLCECGKETEVLTFSIKNGNTTSCGCYFIEVRSAKKTKPRKDIKPNGASSANYVYLTYKRNARVRNFPFELTKDEFLKIVVKDCTYCGSIPSQVHEYAWKKSGSFIYNGVDRVDNKKGYTIENSVPCCTTCNKAKACLSLEDFKNWIKRLVQHTSGGLVDSNA